MLNVSVEKLTKKISGLNDPRIIERNIDVFLCTCLEEKTINLYEAYVIHQEKLRFTYRSVTEPAWNKSPSESHLWDFLNHKNLSSVFDYDIITITKQIENIYKILPKRKHYIFEVYSGLISNPPDNLTLIKLSNIRKMKSISDYYYPFHASSFPYINHSPEDLLLNKVKVEKIIRPELEDLIVELALIE